MARQRSKRSTPWGEFVLYGLFGLLVLGGLGAGGLYAAGYFDVESGPSRDGQLACPAIVRPVNAYSAITRNDLINPQTGQLHVVWLPEATANVVLRDLLKIIGRVAKRDKEAGMALTESDFFPAGTRPGLAAGIPPGMRAVSIETNEIEGLSLLRMGDRFDLFAALPSDPDIVPETEYAVLLGGIKPADTRAGQLAKQTGVRTLVRGGQMIALTRGTTRSTEGQQGLVVPANQRSRNTQVTTATIGVAPEEVTPLTEALGLETRIVCVTHSGNADDQTNAVAEISLDGLHPVVAPVRAVSAYAAIRQEDLVDPVSGRLNSYYFQPDAIDRQWLTGFGDLVGRVLRRDVAPGEPIKEADLLPLGTRPGVVAGAPEGTVVIHAAGDRLPGVDNLVIGDYLTIYQSLAQEIRPAYPAHEWATIQGGKRSLDDAALQETLQSGVRVIASDVVFLGRKDSPEPVSDTEGATLTYVLAVPPERVVPVTQALTGSDSLSVTAQPAAKNSPGSRPLRQSPFDAASIHDDDVASQWVPVANYVQRNTVPDDVRDDDMVAVPVTARTIEPFTRLSPEDFVDPTTGRLREFYFPADQIDPLWVLSVKDLVDRVTSVEVGPGRSMTASDLLPAGTRPGVAAGVPDGYVALEVTSLQVDGLSIPEIGGQIDLVASRPLAAEAAQAKSGWAASLANEVFYEPQAADIFTQADTRALCHAAILLSKEAREFEFVVENETESAADEVKIGEDGTSRRGVTRTTEPKILTRSGLACTLAVPQDAVPAITEALSVQRLVDDAPNDGQTGEESESNNDSGPLNEVLIYAVAHSSRPDVTDPVIPTIDVLQRWMFRWGRQFLSYQDTVGSVSNIHRMEQIRGTARTTANFIDGQPASGQQADVAIESATVRQLLDGSR